MLKPLLACPLPLRSLPIYSFHLLQAFSARSPLVLAPVRALAQAQAQTQTQTQTSNLNSKLAALASAIPWSAPAFVSSPPLATCRVLGLLSVVLAGSRPPNLVH
jgi:hypothetical protein